MRTGWIIQMCLVDSGFSSPSPWRNDVIFGGRAGAPRRASLPHLVEGSMWWWVLLVAVTISAKRAPSPQEPVIEEVTAKQLERVLAEKDYVAVFWCKYFKYSNMLQQIRFCHTLNSFNVMKNEPNASVECPGSWDPKMSYPDLARPNALLLLFTVVLKFNILIRPRTLWWCKSFWFFIFANSYVLCHFQTNHSRNSNSDLLMNLLEGIFKFFLSCLISS